MKRLGQKRIQFRKVVIPGSVKLRQLMAEPHVIELAKSFKEDSGGRPLQAPTLDAKSFRLVAGADRFAAMKVNGDESAIFEMVDGSEEELRRLSIVENLRRRNDDQQKLARQLVEAAEKQITREADKGQCPVSTRDVTRPHSVRGEAIKRVAKETGKSVAAIKKAVQREEKAEREEDAGLSSGIADFVPTQAKPAELPAPPPPIRTLGIELPRQVEDDARQAQEMVEELSRMCTTIATKLTGFEKAFPKLGQQQRAREGLEMAANAIRVLKPDCICPHCKAQGKHLAKCLFCKGLGFVAKAKLVDVPKELMAEGDECGIYVDGKWTLLDCGF